MARPAAVNGHGKQKAMECRGGKFPGSARRQDAEIPRVYFKGRQRGKTQQFALLRRKGGNTAKPINSPLCGALYSKCITLN